MRSQLGLVALLCFAVDASADPAATPAAPQGCPSVAAPPAPVPAAPTAPVATPPAPAPAPAPVATLPAPLPTPPSATPTAPQPVAAATSANHREADPVAGLPVRVDFRAGPFMADRGMRFSSDPEARSGPPEHPRNTLYGIAMHAGLFSARQPDPDRVSGLGLTLDAATSLGASLDAMDDTGYGTYALTHRSAEGGLHYRFPIRYVTLDAALIVGHTSYATTDLPESIQIPDVAYDYLGAGARVELTDTRGTHVGLGASYQALTGAGDVTEGDWYGGGEGRRFALAADVTLAVSRGLYVTGAAEYRRVKIDFEGGGRLSQEWGVWDVIDTAIHGSLQLGATF